ncbi:putative PurR-regulated permease PerM [Mycetocola sp. BIGb0189]|uniref:AI-2E family transporter n=1 Tax=Mycetocola sp. BIGb0189 TaxID=2940604 RepID=UPI002168DF70|nr:AI-2E family transporter [Mycetocola sp. BIGb0189]MCS4276637.1 putative PurR-regulated permease PerM [Mycetocola sp. BIGb0189]
MPLFSRRRSSQAAPIPKKPTLWTDGFGRVATRSLQVLVVLALVAAVLYLVSQVSVILIAVILALILSAAISPFVSWMRRRGVHTMLATWISLLAIVIILGTVVWLIVWAVQSQWDDLADSASDGLSTLQGYLKDLPFTISDDQLDDFKDSISGFLTSAQFGNGALAGVSAATSFFTGLVLMIVVLFFFLKDGPKIWEFLLRPFTGEGYERARRVGDKTVSVLGGYFRGTAAVAAVDAIGIGIGLAIVGVPLALPLAVVVFIMAFIPIVGATLAGAVAALVALVANGPVAAIIVIGIVVLVNQLEGNFLQPVLMARSLKLHALVVLLALTAGTLIAGIIGAVLAVPIAAVAWGIISVWNGENTPAIPAQQKRPEEV